MRYHFGSRGWNTASGAALAVALVGACILANISVQLRTTADYQLSLDILDRLVLVGIALPVAVMARQFEDRAAWMFVTGARNRVLVRARYFAMAMAPMLLSAVVLGWIAAQPGFARLVLADFVLLLGAAVVSAVVLGAQLSWTLPVAITLGCSTPGLVPLSANLLVRQDASGHLMVAGFLLLALSAASFCLFDDYGLSRRRLLVRQSGVTDE
ncbi:MAG: hypothetical protein NTX33_11955 [Propionibacteriales bacterium]|nr:hypothetical protein [Propionibacteriales bacterium]